MIMADAVPRSASGISSDDIGVQLRVNSDAMFDPGSTDLTDSGRKVLDSVLDVLREYNVYLVVRGHADAVESAHSAYASPWDLSAARAAATVRYLTERGITPTRLRAVAYADTRPVEPGTSEASLRRNRRVEFYFTGPKPEPPAWNISHCYFPPAGQATSQDGGPCGTRAVFYLLPEQMGMGEPAFQTGLKHAFAFAAVSGQHILGPGDIAHTPPGQSQSGHASQFIRHTGMRFQKRQHPLPLGMFIHAYPAPLVQSDDQTFAAIDARAVKQRIQAVQRLRLHGVQRLFHLGFPQGGAGSLQSFQRLRPGFRQVRYPAGAFAERTNASSSISTPSASLHSVPFARRERTASMDGDRPKGIGATATSGIFCLSASLFRSLANTVPAIRRPRRGRAAHSPPLDKRFSPRTISQNRRAHASYPCPAGAAGLADQTFALSRHRFYGRGRGLSVVARLSLAARPHEPHSRGFRLFHGALRLPARSLRRRHRPGSSPGRGGRTPSQRMAGLGLGHFAPTGRNLRQRVELADEGARTQRLAHRGSDNLSAIINSSIKTAVSGGLGLAGSTMTAVWLAFLFVVLAGLGVVYAPTLHKLTLRVTQLPEASLNRFILTLRNALRAVFIGLIFVPIIQGTLTGVGLRLVGVSEPAFWGLLAAFAAVIPVVGTALVWAPLALVLWIQGSPGAALGLAAWAPS